VDIALHIFDFTVFGSADGIAPGLAATGRAADEAGFRTITVMDHYFQMDRIAPASDPMLEGYTTLGYLAGQTSQVTLGLLVTGVTYRHPGLLAKILATLDVLSGGRAQLGIGAAWYEREHNGLGIPFPPISERFERLEEALQICRRMWDRDETPFDGKHYQLAEPLCYPKPLHRIPIVIGGSGERKTLRLVAQYADACNLFDAGPDAVRGKLDVLRRHCDAVGRDYDTVDKTIIASSADPLADTDGFVRDMSTYAELGVSKVWVGSRRPDLPGFVRRVGEEVVPRLREL